jgi:hypothetical protein
MQSTSQRSSATSRGPAMYFGYCHRSKRYRMMDLPDYMSNTQEGMQRLMNDGAAAYQGAMTAYDIVPGYQGASGTGTEEMLRYRQGDCGCGGQHRECGCHCECCVSDADVLVHARCGELRRIPLTFDNETRRDRPVTLELGKFLTHGGKDLGWTAQLSETQFTLHPCDEHTLSLLVAIRCKTDDTSTTLNNQNNPTTNVPGTANTPSATGAPATGAPATGAPATGAPANVDKQATINRDAFNRDTLGLDLAAIDARLGRVDKCQVGYATIRAEGCLTRPIVVAIAVLPEDCDSFRHPCGCGCCH